MSFLGRLSNKIKHAPLKRMNTRGIIDDYPYVNPADDILLNWINGGIAKPHPKEWTPMIKGSFERELKFIRQINGQLRPYIVLPVQLPADTQHEYPVTFFCDTGSPIFFIGNQLFNVYREEFNATKYVS